MFFELVERKIQECERVPGASPYHCYCQGTLAAIDELIESNCFDPNEKDIEDSEPLFLYVIETENIDLVKTLVQLGADVNSQDARGEFALLRTARIGWEEGFHYLKPLTADKLRERAIQALAQYRIYRQRLQNHAVEALVNAAFRGNWNAASNAISQGAEINTISSNGEAALHAAIRMNRVSMVKALLAAGADPNLKEEDQNYSPLMVALNSAKVKPTIWNALLDAGADINYQAERGETALMLAVFKLNLPATRQLLERGADYHIKDISGNTALSIAKHMRQQSDELNQKLAALGSPEADAIEVEDVELLQIIALLESFGSADS